MRFEELSDMMQKPEPKPDTYEAGMAQNQLLKIGSHAIRLHNMIDDSQEMESWVAKKIDLASNYVKSVHGYTAGQKAGTYDDDGMSEARLQSNYTVSFQMPKGNHRRNSFASQDDAEKFADTVKSKGGIVDSVKLVSGKNADDLSTSVRALEEKECPPGQYYCKMSGKCKPIQEDASGFKLVSQAKDIAKKMAGNLSGAVKEIEKLQKDLSKNSSVQQALSQFNEDAGEGHMSKSQLYQTAKMAIELIDMIKKGDDLEGWVQTKLNLAADYLQAVYHYEDYQKLNPYREEIDSALMQKHAGVIQKNLDEILARETKTADVDTKPGMMRILKKRVNEVEKEIAKENRKETNESGILYRAGVKKYGKAGMKAIQSAAGKGANHQEIGKIKDRHLNDEQVIEEGIKEWGQRLAMAGVIVAGLAGFNSINDAIDNSVPAISAMNTALEMAQDSNNDDLAKMIEKDLSDAKVRLSSGKDLSYVAGLQEKYAKFMKTEGLAYESKLAVQLNQQLK